MEANQIYEFINEVQAEALGERAQTVKDTSSLVSLGEVVLSSDRDTDNFYRVLADKIGRTYIQYRRYYRDGKKMQRTPLEFGIILQKVQIYKMAKAKENGSWSNQVNPFAKEKDTTDIMQALFSKLGTWEVETKIIYDYQLKTAFTDATAFASFTELIFSDMYNALEYEIEQCEKLTRATTIAQSFKSPNKNIARNLLKEYNTKFNQSLTTEECIYDASFDKYASMEISKVVKRLPKMSTVFNGIGADRFTPTENIVCEILSDFASATASYLESGTYHKELVSLPMYDEVDCWQSSGTDYDFDTTSKINITDESGVTVEQGGIIAVVRDSESCAVMVDRIRTKSIYNPASELTNYFHKADYGTLVDASQNCVIFYVADDTEVNPTLKITVPAGSTSVGTKTVADLQDGVFLSGDMVNGTLEYMTNFDSNPDGNYLALKVESEDSATVEVRNGSGTFTELEDDILLLRVADKSQAVTIRATMGDKKTTNVIKLNRLVLES